MSGYLEVIFPQGISSAFKPAFDDAAAFWNNVLVSGAPPSTLTNGLDVSGTQCGVDYEFPPGTVINGLKIFSSTPPIDGVGQILGRAGPCVYHGSIFQQPLFPMLGIMEFDSADSQSLLESGQFGNVVVHEMGHVIGIGTLWPVVELLNGPCPLFIPRPCDPFYNGPNGIQGFRQLNPPASIGGLPPVANTGGTGTANGHWREVTFENELMTGYLNAESDNPLSIMTVLSLKDLSYEVNPNAAEPYTVPAQTREIAEDAIQLFSDTIEFEFQFIEEIKDRFPARNGVTSSNNYEDQIAGLFLFMLFGFIALGAFMGYLQRSQRKQFEKLVTSSKVKATGTVSPMFQA